MATDTKGSPIEDKDGLLKRITEKVEAFGEQAMQSEDGRRAIGELELLYKSIAKMSLSDVTSEFIERTMTTHLLLTTNSLVKGLSGERDVKPQRRKNSVIERCASCGGIIEGGTCSDCSMDVRPATAKVSKNKSKDQMAEKRKEFPDKLNILLGNVEMPEKLHAMRHHVERALIGLGHDIKNGKRISEKDMRDAFKEAEKRIGGEEGKILSLSYIWCTRMRYEITGYKPADMTQEEKDRIAGYYNRILLASYEAMTEDVKYGAAMSNMWNIQVYLTLILTSSDSLIANHSDFYDSLHVPNRQTDDKHCKVWNQMVYQNRWTFE